MKDIIFSKVREDAMVPGMESFLPTRTKKESAPGQLSVQEIQSEFLGIFQDSLAICNSVVG